MGYFKERITGGFDLLFLFGRGIERFSGTKREGVQSLLVPLAAFAVALVIAWYRPLPPKILSGGMTHVQMMFETTVHFVLSFILSNVAVASIAKALGRLDKFWLFFAAGNWVVLPLLIVTSPLLAMGLMGAIAHDQLDRIFAIITCYSYLVTACIAWRAFTINWQIAGMIAIVILAIDQELWHAIYALRDTPFPW